MAFADLVRPSPLLPARRTIRPARHRPLPRRSVSIIRCGIRKCRTSWSVSACCATTFAGTVRPTLPRAITASPTSDATRWRFSMGSAIDRVIWCGQSIGGMVGQWLAINAADRLSHLVLANTTPRMADPPAWKRDERRCFRAAWPPLWKRRCAGSSRRLSSSRTRRASRPHARPSSRRTPSDTPAAVPRSATSITRHAGTDSNADARDRRRRGRVHDVRRSRRGAAPRNPRAPRWSGWPPRTFRVSSCRARSRVPCSTGSSPRSADRSKPA